MSHPISGNEPPQAAYTLIVVLELSDNLWDANAGAACWRWHENGLTAADKTNAQVLLFPVLEGRRCALVAQDDTEDVLPGIVQAVLQQYPSGKTCIALHGLDRMPPSEAEPLTKAFEAISVELHSFHTGDPFREALKKFLGKQAAAPDQTTPKATAAAFDATVNIIKKLPLCKKGRELSRLLPLLIDLHGLAACPNEAAKRRYAKDWAESGGAGTNSLSALWDDVKPFGGGDSKEPARNAAMDEFLRDLDKAIQSKDADDLLRCTSRLSATSASHDTEAAAVGGFFVITQNDHLGGALTRTLRHKHDTELLRFSWGVPDALQKKDTSGSVEACFERLADQMEACFGHNGSKCLSGSVGFVDLGEGGATFLDDLNPLKTTSSRYDAVAAMLVLAFPEVHWVFLGIHAFRQETLAKGGVQETKETVVGTAQREAETVAWAQNAHVVSTATGLDAFMRNRADRFTPLFDPTGLRNALRAQANSTLQGHSATALPMRTELAAALDEEKAYACFNAYAAYRFGFRSWVVGNWRTMQRVFKRAENAAFVSLVFEDFSLEFPDAPEENGIQYLCERERKFPGLSNNRRRIAVTSSHRSGGATSDDLVWTENIEYYKKKQNNQVIYYDTVPKPFGGLFALWQRSGAKYHLEQNKGKGADYRWPVTDDTKGDENKSKNTSHSAPGRLLCIARRLTDRAARILRDALSIPEAVYAATLALDAQEYLRGSTPTAALEALALQHRAEVQAECEFYGVDYNMEVRSRLREIADVVAASEKWFAHETRFLSNRNAQIKIIGEITTVYRDHNQFDEEQICLMATRDLLRQLRFGRMTQRHAIESIVTGWNESVAEGGKMRRAKRPLVFSSLKGCLLFPLYYPIRWYLGNLINSTSIFGFCIAAWLTVFTIAFTTKCPFHPPSGRSIYLPLFGDKSSIWVHGFSDAVNTCVALQPPHELATYDDHPKLLLFVLFGIFIGLFHIGIFISHIYTYLTRR